MGALCKRPEGRELRPQCGTCELEPQGLNVLWPLFLHYNFSAHLWGVILCYSLGFKHLANFFVCAVIVSVAVLLRLRTRGVISLYSQFLCAVPALIVSHATRYNVVVD